MNTDIKQIILIVVVTFLTSAFLMPLMRKIAFHTGIVDIPLDNRRMHKDTVPKLGSFGIFLSFLLGYMLFCKQSIQMNSILIGGFIIVLTGLIDDIKPIKARYKMIGQILAALIITLYGNIVMTEISAFSLHIEFKWMSIPMTIFFIVGTINCIGFIDGIDGLSSGIASIYFLTIGIIGVMMGNSGSLEIILSFIMLGSTLGYLLFNFEPAKIFMSDSGAMFLGYIIAVIALLGFKNVTLTTLFIPILLLAIPILDTLASIIRRLLKGESVATPDKQHLHHQLVRMTGSVKKTVFIIYLINILFASASILYVLQDQVLGIIVYAILFIIISWIIMTTNIIIERKEKERKKTRFKRKKSS